jgi:hypothetical protein
MTPRADSSSSTSRKDSGERWCETVRPASAGERFKLVVHRARWGFVRALWRPGRLHVVPVRPVTRTAHAVAGGRATVLRARLPARLSEPASGSDSGLRGCHDGATTEPDGSV